MADRKVQLKHNDDNLYPKTVAENVYDVQPNGTKVSLVDIVNTLIDQDEDLDARVGKFENGINVGTDKVISSKPGYAIEANSAAKLKTARRIALTGGVSGYADFDGTKSVSVPVTNVSSAYIQEPARSVITTTSMPLMDYTRSNKLAFLPADQIIVEKTTDGGVTWTDAEVSDAVKAKVFSDVRQEAIYIPLKNGVKSSDCAVRLTITGMKYNVPAGTGECSRYNYWNKQYVTDTERYLYLSKLYAWARSHTDRIYCKVECATGDSPDVWVTRYITTSGADALEGSPGGNFLSFAGTFLGGGIAQTGNYWNWRITFRTCATDGSLDDSKLDRKALSVQQFIIALNGYGPNVYRAPADNNMAKTGHLYGWDYQKNAVFPNAVTSEKFIKRGGSAAQFLKANGDTDSTVYQPKTDSSLATASKTVAGAVNEVKAGVAANTAAISRVNTEVAKKLDAADFDARIGANGGVCPLDADGTVASQYLPGYVDDVVELSGFISAKPAKAGLYYNSSARRMEEYEEVMPRVVELINSYVPASGKIYLNLTDSKLYRWSGSAMAVISETIALGETGSTAYRGDRGKVLYDWYGRADAGGNINRDKLNNLPACVCGVGGGYPDEAFVLNVTATDATIDFRYISLGDGGDRMGDYPLRLPASTPTKAGLMTAVQYNKLNGVKETLVYDLDKVMNLASGVSGDAAREAWTPAGKTSPVVPTGENSKIYDFEFRGRYYVGHLLSLYDESAGEGFIYFTILYNSFDGVYIMYVEVDLSASYYTHITEKKLV